MKVLKRYGGPLAVAVAVAASGVVAGSIAQVSADPGHVEPDDTALTPVAGSHRLPAQPEVGARSTNDGSWVVRRYTGQTGLDCYEVGQLRDGRFGNEVAGRFVPWPTDMPTGLCGDLDSAPQGALLASTQFGNKDGSAVRETVVYGVASRDITGVSVAGADSGSREVRVNADGGFVAAFAGEVDVSSLDIRFTRAGGASEALRR